MKGLLHLHARKRASKDLHPMPARGWKRILDRVVFTVGVLGPAASLPQLVTIYLEKNASGLVAVSWGAWAAMNVPWIVYGIVHKEKPIMVTYTLWFIINSAVCIGALLYGGSLY